MRKQRPSNRARYLRDCVQQTETNGQFSPQSENRAHDWVEVSSGDRTKREDQHNQDRSSRQRITEQSQSNITVR